MNKKYFNFYHNNNKTNLKPSVSLEEFQNSDLDSATSIFKTHFYICLSLIQCEPFLYSVLFL